MKIHSLTSIMRVQYTFNNASPMSYILLKICTIYIYKTVAAVILFLSIVNVIIPVFEQILETHTLYT